MPATGFTGQPVSAFPPANALFNPLLAQQQTANEQTLGMNEAEMIARVSQGLLDPKLYPDEASRAAAWGPAVQQLRGIGFAQKAPDEYPGEATLRRAALLGTSSTKLAEWNYNTGVNQAGLGPTGTEQPSTGAGSGGGAGGGGGSDPGFTGDKEHDLALIKQRESSGDYKALNYVAKADPTAYARGATASGAYQIVNSTWREGVTMAGVDVSKYPTAASAPPEIQDKVASSLYDRYGTRPWDPSKWGKNWAKTEGGRYELRPTGGGQGGGGGGGGPPAPTTTTTTQATPTAPPASPFGAGAFAPPTRTVAAAPATTADAPNVPTNLVPPVSTPQMVAAQAVAARTGKPAPIEGTDGLFALPGGGVSSGPTAGGLGRRAAGDAIIEGQQTAATTLPPQGGVLAAGPAAGGGAVPRASAEAPVSAFGGGAFATPPPNMLAPGTPGAPATATVQPAPQNVVAPTPAPAAPTAPAPAAPAPAAPAMPQPPRLPAVGADNLTADDRRQLQTMVRDDPARFTAAKTAMQARNIALQEKALADYDRAQAAARAQQQFAATQEQRRIENERAAAAAKIQQQQEIRAQEKFDQERVEANRPYPGKSLQDTERNILIAGSQPGGDPSSIAYRNAYNSQKYHQDINGNTIVRNMDMFAPPREPSGGTGGADAAPTVTKAPSTAPDKAREGMLGNASGQIKIVKALDALEAYPGAVGGMNVQLQNDYFLQRTDPQGVAARQAVANIQTHLFHELAGAAQSPAESERLKPYAPKATDTYATIQTKLKGLLDINRETMLQAYRTYGPETGGVRLPVIEEAIIASIPQPAIEDLMKDPKSLSKNFDKIYGKGAAKLVLSNG